MGYNHSIERLCRDYRRGRITADKIRMELAKHILTTSEYNLSMIAEKLSRQDEEEP